MGFSHPFGCYAIENAVAAAVCKVEPTAISESCGVAFITAPPCNEEDSQRKITHQGDGVVEQRKLAMQGG